MTNKVTLGERGNDGKLSLAFIKTVNNAYSKMSVQLHQAACLAFYRLSQHGCADAMNALYGNLRVNDQTALRVWVGERATYTDLENMELRPWVKFTKDKGFAVIKDREQYRKDMFTIDSEETGKTMLIMERPFYDKNVKDKDAITLESLIQMLAKAADNVSKKSDKEQVKLPDGIANLVTSIKNSTTKELKALARVKE